MKSFSTRVWLTLLAAMLCASMARAQTDAAAPRVYRDGPVTDMSYIKVRPGKFDDYMRYLDGPYKTLMEAKKKAGLIIDFAVYSVEARKPDDPDLILTTTYANMAALDRTEEDDALSARILADAQPGAPIDKEAMRQYLGGTLMRQMILK